MAQITWRNVDAPNFSGVGDSIRSFSGLLGNATAGLSDALGNFQTAARQEVGNQVMQNALQYQDPTEYRNALASGALFQGVDPSLISNRTLENLDNRTGNLLNQATQQQALDYNTYRTGRMQDLDARGDAASPALRQLALAYQSGDPNTIARAQQQYGGALDSLPADQVQEIMGRLQNQGSNAIGQRRDLFNLGTNMRDDADSQAAIGVLSQIVRGAENPNDARILAEAYSKQLSPTAQARLQGLLAQQYPGTYGNNVTSAPGTAGTRSGSPFDVTYQFQGTSKPITQMSIGEVTNHQANMISSQGASPVGAYQINKATLEDFAPKVLGENWRNMPLSPENQDKIGEAIFNARKNGNLKDTWAALPDSTVGAYKNRTWNEMKGLIAQAEVGANPLAVQQAVQGNQAVSNLATGMIGTRLMENNAVGNVPDYLRTLGDTATPGEVVNRLLENDFKGADRNWVLARVNEIAQRAGVSPAMAATVMQRAQTNVPENMIWRGLQGLNPFISNEAGNGTRLNDDAVDQMVGALQRGEPLEQSVRNLSTAQAAQNVQAAQQAYDAALAQLQNTQNKISTGQTALTALLPSRQAAVERAQMMLQAAQQQVTADPQNLAPRTFQSQATTDRAVKRENDSRAERYLRQANQIPGYMQTR
ncbi:structural protein [Klebsiella phage KP8]|uniref:Structural protein n=1 Tax=Klebsiella phage KP8 TaxID=2099850 RepID=A0A2P1CCM2_9CAUD|nr:virion structural protein [Klebsiella phage KP8]AVJ48978.1 structural protein [Klebsiella phage KP8]